MAALVSNYGGQPLSASGIGEVPLDAKAEAFAFIDALHRHDFTLVILLTGVGTRALLAVVDRRGVGPASLSAVDSTKIAARGPKPVAVLRELGMTPWVVAPEPNTWRELLAALDAQAGELTLRGARVAVQEYGTSNAQLVEGLRERGAAVVSVPVYRYALPDDLGPLQAAARAVAGGDLDVVLFTTATQVVHLLDVARQLNVEPAVRQGLAAMAGASIGPTTSEELRGQGVAIGIQARHPKMGFCA